MRRKLAAVVELVPNTVQLALKKIMLKKLEAAVEVEINNVQFAQQ